MLGLVAWWRVECPVRPEEQAWIDESMDWFVAQFRRDRLLGEVVLPTDDDFPGVYRGSRADVVAVFDRLCAHMGVDPDRVDFEFGDDTEFGDDMPAENPADGLSGVAALTSRQHAAAGHYRERRGRPVVSISPDQARAPMTLVATIAHELGHVLLVGGHRITSDRKDHEPLTDLLTVVFGLGIFGANAAFDYTRQIRGRHVYSRTSRLGYMTEPMFGYGLARYAWLRGEESPSWSQYVDTNPRAFLKRGLRYLHQQA